MTTRVFFFFFFYRITFFQRAAFCLNCLKRKKENDQMRAFQCGCGPELILTLVAAPGERIPPPYHPAPNRPVECCGLDQRNVSPQEEYIHACALLRVQWWARSWATDGSFLCVLRLCLYCRAVAQHRKLGRRMLLLSCFIPVCFGFFAMISGQKKKKGTGVCCYGNTGWSSVGLWLCVKV